MRRRDHRWLATVLASVMLLTVLGVVPVTAQSAAADECRGGGPGYWVSNPWPEPFAVPYVFRQPSGKQAIVRKWTKFDAVFRYRYGRDKEGKIYPNKTLKQVLKSTALNKKAGLARQAIAALLNAGEKQNQSPVSKFWVIKDFQLYWDGVDGMTVGESRKYMKKKMIKRNTWTCPPV